MDATSTPTRLLLLGGTSDIAVAIGVAYASRGTRHIVLAARADSAKLPAAREAVERAGAQVEIVDFDARDTDSHPDVLDRCFAGGDIDLAVVAFGLLGDAEQLWTDQQAAIEVAQVNFVGALSVGVLLADKMKAQGHGQIVAISSVAGVRVRRSNFVYGATKAGMDGFYLNLGEALRGSGVGVTVVRPGFVRTSMTAGMKAAPLSVSAEEVAAATVEGVLQRRRIVWSHRLFGPIMFALQNVPQPLFRLLPF